MRVLRMLLGVGAHVGYVVLVRVVLPVGRIGLARAGATAPAALRDAHAHHGAVYQRMARRQRARHRTTHLEQPRKLVRNLFYFISDVGC